MTLFDVSELEPGSQAEAGPQNPTGEPPDVPFDISTGTETGVDSTAATVGVVDTADTADADASDGAPQVEVRVSSRRRKTSEARWANGRIVVSLPAHLDPSSRQQTIDWLVQRLLTRYPRQADLDEDALLARAVALSERYLLGVRPSSVRWVTNQTARWGSCSYYTGDIRISHRLRPVPAWVLDSVLVHELAHLTYPDHSPAFHRLANSYPRHGEAGTFLAGYELGLSHPMD
jgi:Protein of unknown function DUF45